MYIGSHFVSKIVNWIWTNPEVIFQKKPEATSEYSINFQFI